MDGHDTLAPEGEPFEKLLADEARLRILLSVAFDYSWEMTPKGEDDLQIHMFPTARPAGAADAIASTHAHTSSAPAKPAAGGSKDPGLRPSVWTST